MACRRLTRGLASAAVGVLLLTAYANGQATTRVSIRKSGLQADLDSAGSSISADGLIVAFTSLADNLVPGDTNHNYDVFVHDRTTGITERVSVDSSGVQGDQGGQEPAISGDGRFVAFSSASTNLVPGDTNRTYDVFVRDRLTGVTDRVSVDSSGNEGNDGSATPSISFDGRYVAFSSLASNLVSGDTNGTTDVFVRDRSTGVTERVSVSSSGGEGDSWSNLSAISSDGSVVAFSSDASNLVSGDTNSEWDVLVRDRVTGTTERVSVDSSGAESDDYSYWPSISADGRVVAFNSVATNLVAGDTNSFEDVFVHDRTTAVTERASVDSSGAEGDDYSSFASISADGLVVAFASVATNLVAGDTNSSEDVFVHDRTKGITERVSVDSSGRQGNSHSGVFIPAMSDDGWVVAFGSIATNLVPGDTNHRCDIFVHERCITPASWSNYGSGFPGTFGVPALTSQQNPVLGTTITIDLANSLHSPTTGILFVGFQRTDIPTNRGGHLLVVPALTVPITFSYGGDWFTGDIPDDWPLCGFTIDLQAIQSDPGAAFGMSFTAGLELVLGR